jgi:steroid 5-alpha reductase family enzyme
MIMSFTLYLLGALVYHKLRGLRVTILEVFLITLSFTIILFYWVWILAIRIKNFSVVDAAWALAFFVHSLIFYSLMTGFQKRRTLLLFLMSVWSLRLGFFLAKRTKSHHPKEDTRYLKLREKYGADYEKKFLFFFLWQAVSVSFLTFPSVFVFNNPTQYLSLFEIFGSIVFLASVAGETLADFQMAQFKSLPANKGKVCNVGLWRYSRHPNYFFESCVWVSLYLFWLGTPGLWWAAYAPLSIVILLVKVTGVPPSEEQSLKSKGEQYINYQKVTSVFVPWRPKNGK